MEKKKCYWCGKDAVGYDEKTVFFACSKHLNKSSVATNKFWFLLDRFGAEFWTKVVRW